MPYNIVDSLKREGFKNLTYDEIYKEDLKAAKDNNPPNTKQRLYTAKGLRKIHKLRKVIFGGVCKVTLVMKEPNCTSLESLFWNSNLAMGGASYYSMQLKQLGYQRSDDRTIEEYENTERGFRILVRIRRKLNEINFTISKL